jgi:hypothetical protein
VTERDVIEGQLAKKQAEIESLEDKVRAAKVYVAALRDVLKLMDKAGRQDANHEDGETKLRAGSAAAQTRDIILARGEPMHIDDLLDAMGKEQTRDAKTSLASSLAAYVRREDIFTRPAPNTFGLIELGHFEVEEEVEAEPPVGFGRSNPFANDFDDEVPF